VTKVGNEDDRSVFSAIAVKSAARVGKHIMKHLVLPSVILFASAFAASADDSPRVQTVPPTAVVATLKQQNYRRISQPLRDGRFYSVTATTPHGQRVNLYIDAHTGRIVDVKGE